MSTVTKPRSHNAEGRLRSVSAIPPQTYFAVSAIFHYLGPAFAVLLFAHVGVLGVAWLRIASAALIFAMWRRPWRAFAHMSWEQRRIVVSLGIVLGAMNVSFYEAIARVPLGTVGAIEFIGPVVLALVGSRSRRNVFALGLAIAGVALLTDVRIAGEPLGFFFAFANCALFTLYVMLGHRIAQDADGGGVDRVGAAMLVATLTVLPVGFERATVAFTQPVLLLAGIGVGVCSSVIPYVCDQLAMARLPRASFALMLALLPACAAISGIVVLRQIPQPVEVAGVLLVVLGVACHQEPHKLPGSTS